MRGRCWSIVRSGGWWSIALNFLAISWREQVVFQLDGDEVRFL